MRKSVALYVWDNWASCNSFIVFLQNSEFCCCCGCCVTGSARSLPTRSSTVSVQANHTRRTAAGRRRSHAAIGSLQTQPSASPSAAIVRSISVSAAGTTTAGGSSVAGPSRSHNATQWLMPENAGSSRTVPAAAAAAAAEMSSYAASSRHDPTPPEVSVDVCGVSSLSDFDAQLETLNR